MANFIGLVYATLKENGIDTKGMSTDEAVAKFKELQGEGKEEKKDTPEDVKKKLNGEEIKAENVKKGETSEDVNKRYNAYKEQNKHYLEEIKKGLGGEKPNQVQVRKAVQHLIEQKGELNGWDANMIKDELGADTTQVQNAFSYMQFNKNKKEQPSEIKDKSIKKEEKKEDSFERKTSFEDNREIDWDLAEKNEKINGKNAKNPNRHDKYGNELLSDEAFKIGLEAGKSHLDYMLQYDTISSLKRSNVFLRGLQETIDNAITNNGFNPNQDITYTDTNEIIGNLLGEEVDVEKDELRTGNPYTGREYIGYRPK